MNSTGLEVVDLKEISVLRYLSNEELGDIKAVHVYGTYRSSFEGLSALYLTKNDEVYLAGFDSLVGKCCLKEAHHGHRSAIVQSRKVEELSGRGLKKIVIGDEFGAALTTSSDLYLWGNDVGCTVPAGLSELVLEKHYDGASCPKCSKKLSKSIDYELLSICVCDYWYQNRVSALPAPTDLKGSNRIVLGYVGTDTAPKLPNLFCIRCRKEQQCKVVTVRNFSLLYCFPGNKPYHLMDGEPPIIPSQTDQAPHKVTFNTSLQNLDIAAGKNFLLIHTSSNVIIWGDLGGVKYNCGIKNPDNVTISKLSCGSSHIAVVSDKGGLYTCGLGGEGQLGYDQTSDMDRIALRKVSLNGQAVDVACGHNSTVCLLENGTYVVYGAFTEVASCGTWSMSFLEKAIICVPIVASHVGIVQSSMQHLLVPTSKRSTVLTGDLSDIFIHLHGFKSDIANQSVQQCVPCYETDLKPLKTERATSDNVATSDHQCLKVGHLYGQKLISDLTLKLSDGEFPAHRLVLFAASAYFSQLLSKSESPQVLDMSSYNPEAYRSLLKYFYGVPIGQMSPSDLFDLYELALSYKEDSLTDVVLSKLKRSIDAENVILLLDKAKVSNATELIKACKSFINNPEVKKSFCDRLYQDEDMLETVMRLSVSQKP